MAASELVWHGFIATSDAGQRWVCWCFVWCRRPSIPGTSEFRSPQGSSAPAGETFACYAIHTHLWIWSIDLEECVVGWYAVYEECVNYAMKFVRCSYWVVIPVKRRCGVHFFTCCALLLRPFAHDVERSQRAYPFFFFAKLFVMDKKPLVLSANAEYPPPPSPSPDRNRQISNHEVCVQD